MGFLTVLKIIATALGIGSTILSGAATVTQIINTKDNNKN